MADVLSSAVRLPTPPPGTSYSPGPSKSRKRSPPSRSPSPRRRKSPPRDRQNGETMDHHEPDARERELQARFKTREFDEARRKPMTEEEKQASAKAEYEKLLTMRSGGTYIPPARLRALQSQITDKTSKEYQRMAWEALKKSINGLINKVNVSNIKHIVPELFGENLVRGRGLFCRSIMKAQAASLPFTPIYAAMAAIVNTKLPQVGELLLHRLVMQFRKAFRRNDKAVCLSSTTFIAHLCNQQVAHETVAAQILLLLLHKPTDDSVEIAVGLTREIGQHLEEMDQAIALAVFDQFRSILNEADIDKRTQYMIEVLFQVRKDRYKDNPAIREELDLVEEEDQITHQVDIDGEINVQDGLNIFKFDSEWEEHEEAYRKLKAEILGEGSDDEEEGESGSDESSDEDDDEEQKQIEIKDQTNTDLVNLRKTIYLTIMSSLDFEEATHKLMKVRLPPGQEYELPSMIIECCAQDKTYSKFFGLIGERFGKINRMWCDLFEQAFAKYYDTIHRYETNRLRNIARFFGHMFSTDAIGWHCMSVVHLNEEETTSSSRIFIKILFQELAEALGLPKLQERFKDDILRPSFDGIFPTDNPKNTRFSINYFTSIGLGALTEEMREHLKSLPKPAPPALPAPRQHDSDSESVSSYSSYSSYSSRSYSSSRSPPRRGAIGTGRDRGRDRSRTISVSRSRSPVPRNRRERGRSYSDSISRSDSDSPPGRGRQGGRGRHPTRSPSRSLSPSRSPPRRAAGGGGIADRSGRRGTERGRRRSHSSPSLSRSRSRSPPRRIERTGRRRSPSYSVSRSPPAGHRRSRSADSRTSSPDSRRGSSSARVVGRDVGGGERRGGRGGDGNGNGGRGRGGRAAGGRGSERGRGRSYSRSPSYSASSPSPERRRPTDRRRQNSNRNRDRSPKSVSEGGGSENEGGRAVRRRGGKRRRRNSSSSVSARSRSQSPLPSKRR